MRKINLLAVVLILLASCIELFAQGEPVYERGATYLENIVPPSPESASQVKYADVPFTHSMGMAEYEIPFFTLQGQELNIPVGLSYASGGIKLDEIAGVAGLGWNLQAGGCITRTVMDMPDEFVSSTGSFRHEVPSGQLLTDLEEMNNSNSALNFLRDLVWNRIDVSLDRYSYDICGLSGSFVIQDNGEVFQLSGDGVTIDYTRSSDGTIEQFVLTGPDGTIYTLAMREMAYREGRGMETVDLMNGKLDEWTAPTAWHLTSMRSRSGLETATFTYSDAAIWDRSIITRTETLSVTCGIVQGTPSRNISSNNVKSTYETRVLTGITLNSTTVSFTYAQGTGNAMRTADSPVLQNFPYRLTGMTVSVAGNDVPVKRMEVNTGCAAHDGRIILNGLNSYTDGVMDNKWTFAYKGVGKTVSAGSQDWFGYYNGENEFSGEGNTLLCPYAVSLIGEGSFILTNGFPNADYAAYMSLISVDNDKAVTNFTYEGNYFTTPSGQSSMGVRVKMITLPGTSFRSTKVRHFTYESPFFSGPSEPTEEMYCTVNMNLVLTEESSDCNWQFTMHETPVTLGPSIRDSRIFYGRVIEDVSDEIFFEIDGSILDRNTVRTAYEYSNEDVYPDGEDCSSRFPEFCSEFYDGPDSHPLCERRLGIQDYYNNSGPSVSPMLVRREEYAYRNGTYELVSSTEYEYERLERNSVLVDYYAVQAYRHRVEGYMQLDHIMHFPIYAKGNYGRQPVKETRVGYHSSGNDMSVVNTSYVSRMSMEDPVRVASTKMTEGNVIREVNYEYADNLHHAYIMVGELANQHCLSVPVWRGISYRDISDNSNAPVYKEDITNYGWFDIDGQRYFLPSSHVEYNLGEECWREDVISRDAKGNITSLKEKGQPLTVILWGYKGQLPVAMIQNASISQVQTAMGGENVIMAMMSAETPTSDHWTRLSQLRSSLSQAHVTTYTYRPGIGVESITDPAGQVTTFEYDGGLLVCIRDNDGHKVEEYEYELMSDDAGRRHMRHKVFRSNNGANFSEDVSWWDSYGRKTQDIAVGASGDGSDLVTAYESDFMFHDDVKTWLPFPKMNTGGNFLADAASLAAEHHSSSLAYMLRNYEMSARDRVVSEALPGYAGEHESSNTTDVATGIINYRWENGQILSLSPYDTYELVVSKVTDADGRTTSMYKDHSGKTIATSNGIDAPTYYIYDIYDRLRAVKSSGIAANDIFNMWRYDYDNLGRLSSKGIPGSVPEFYMYDNEDRLVSVNRNGVLKEMEYDSFGRVLKVWQTRPGGQRTLLEEHTYDVYPSSTTGGNPKGLRTLSRLAEVGPDGDVLGYTETRFTYDDKKRLVRSQVRYGDNSTLLEQNVYGFAGEKTSSVYTYSKGSSTLGKLTLNFTYDIRGRLLSENAALQYQGSGQNASASRTYHYNKIGQIARITTAAPGGSLTTAMEYALQGWMSNQETSMNGKMLFKETLNYDGIDSLPYTEASYTGLITRKDDVWYQSNRVVSTLSKGYVYDNSGRLALEVAENSGPTEYYYDARGNLLAVLNDESSVTSEYAGDKLISMNVSGMTSSFTYDDLGRMTYDGSTGQTVTYNDLDLIGNISDGGTSLVNYSYLADGTKLIALDGSGKGLVYRGPFVCRTSNGGSSLTLESAAFSGGRLTPNGVMLHVTDYLGSVRAVINGNSGAVYKVSDYSSFGDESEVGAIQTATTPTGITLRDGYTGKEDQSLDFSTGYTDFGARQYSTTLRRWMTPDPLSEKYYGISPYAFCNNNPVNLVDPDGKKLYFADRVSDVFKQKFAATIQFMNSKGTSGDLAELHESDVVYYIAEIPLENMSLGENKSVFNYKENYIYWDYSHYAQTSSYILLSPATVLAHEAAHAVRYDRAVKDGTKDQWIADSKKQTDSQYDSIEEKNVITTTEQSAALKHGEIKQGQVTRTDHTGERYYVTVSV